MTHRLTVSPRRLAAGFAGVCLLAASPTAAQETTYIGGSGEGGSDNVSVNLDVIGGDGGGSTRERAGPSGGSGELQLRMPGDGDDGGERPEKPDIKPGEVVRAPGGARLRFPLLDEPQSRLTVDMAQFQARQQPERQPTEKPEERGGEPAGEPMVEQQEPDRKPETATTAVAGTRETEAQTDTATADTGSESQATAGAEESTAAATDTGSLDTNTGTLDADTGGAAEPERDQEAASAAAERGERDEGEPVELQPGTKPDDETRTRTAAAETGEAGTQSADTSADTQPDTGGTASDTGTGQTAGEEPAETQTATRTDTTDGAPLETQLTFATGSAELGSETRRQLDRVVAALKKDSDSRIELTAYADVPGDSPSRSRRLSLSRALAVRSYLIEKGVRSTRIDVRALGNAVESGPANRVDIAPASRG
ncbi:Outer membrane protein OmpA [Limimonas halophila]|uniref:Outer membrane protein OmpA n=1 Tax=Limimonas halophila TaxID=1082479 RepID=A0A1G7LS13_9PROT|nr:OmpA family protein [Limimonas halophila]SDF52307.1 Outer membrane protein OmpA [Limimonas halophila]